MSRTALYVVIAVLVCGIGGTGIAYYEHQRNTLMEINVGNHGIEIKKN